MVRPRQSCPIQAISCSKNLELSDSNGGDVRACRAARLFHRRGAKTKPNLFRLILFWVLLEISNLILFFKADGGGGIDEHN